MNYIVLNGKKSSLINGLLIQSLPPITKPKKRIQYEEVDGRDGDSLTNLGYAAYDKEIKIGLFGKYSVDDVIAYFDSNGIVTFSNEPDKYYHYNIVDQIDFDRLLRFKQATVKFHVQPFKYSLVELLSNKDFNLLNITEYMEAKLGVVIKAKGNTVAIQGTTESATELYIPVDIALDPDEYKFTLTASGSGLSQTKVRLIHDTPLNANSFGGRYVYLTDGSVVIPAKYTASKTYNYLWFSIPEGLTIDCSVSLMLEKSAKNARITNVGNIESKPMLTVYGRGLIGISLNGSKIFQIDLGNEEYITIDTENLEAVKDGVLKNRLVTGDYNKFALKVGYNTITFDGDITKFNLRNYSRWI